MSAVEEITRKGLPGGRGKRAAGRQGPRPDRRDNKAAAVFLAPWIVGLVVITLGPMLMSLYLSFTDYNLMRSPDWIGLENFSRMLEDARLHNSLKVTFTYVFVGVPLQLALALAIAMVLDRGLRGLAFYRSVFYLRPCSAPPWRSRSCGSSSSGPAGWSTRCWPSSASRASGGSRTPGRRSAASSCCTCGPSGPR
ncbi:hypothetical protein KTU01_26140 [Kocuria turfanensis]|uniref:ABC transmembrane type-1 domain-containing protein n=1 Tax=Kocuria turfanensis TaxID=388357 RepID=A0A512IFL3_9MICC|nr:hypothetical protein KTU01_26140 [Kocuria turfanensis]